MPMDPLPLLTPLLGALLAGVIGYFAGRGMKTHEWRLAMKKDELTERRKLYAKFLGESHLLVIKHIAADLRPSEVVGSLATIYAEIELLSTPTVTESAKTLLDSTLQFLETTDKGRSIPYYEHKLAFVAAARSELNAQREA